MRTSRHIGPAALLLLACLLWTGGCKQKSREPLRPRFGAKEIAERFCALGPRDSTTPGAAIAAEWIADELRLAGIVPVVDEFLEPDENGRNRVFRNVLASIPGTGSGRFLLMSHYDTKAGIAPDFVGANDGGSSTALLLALARWYRENPCEATISFAFLDGEECVVEYGGHDGLNGSRHLAGALKTSGTALDGVILLDMVGDGDLSLTIPANCSKKMVAALRKAANALEVGMRMESATYEMIDDHDPFHQLGYPALDIIDFEYGSRPGLNDYWHTAEDTVDKLSDETLDTVGALVIGTISRLSAK